MSRLAATYLAVIAERGPIEAHVLWGGKTTPARRRAVNDLQRLGLIEYEPPVTHLRVVYRLTRAEVERRAN